MSTPATEGSSAMDWKLEVVVVPVSDVDRAKEFYADKLGFRLDVDHRAGEHFRVVQLTPPGSACSITIGTGHQRRGAGLGARPAAGGLRHRGGARRAGRRAGCECQRDLALRRGPDAARARSRAPRATARSCPSPTRTATAGRCRRAGGPTRRHDRRPSRPRTGCGRGRLRRRWPSGTGASCTCTATGCWPRYDEAEDAVQETFLRAWRARDSFDGRPLVAGLAVPDRHQRLPGPDPGRGRGSCRGWGRWPRCRWLQPYPDRLLDELAERRTSRTRWRCTGRPSSWRSWPRCRCCRPGSGPR